MKQIFLEVSLAAALAVLTQGQSHTLQDHAMQDHHKKDCPMQEQPSTEHHNNNHEMNMRGDQGMGFAQDKTTHHFLLRKDGGAIQVLANSKDDKTTIAQIRQHLKHISRAFQSGDFNIPMFVHEQTPPGVPEMVRLKDRIHYRYEQSATGAMVVISSENTEAIEALHRFLRFQISEHQTVDLPDGK